VSEPELELLDARGLHCPMPVIELQRAARRLPPGTVVRLLSDDPAASADVAAWCRMQRHELLSVEQSDDGVGAFVVRLRG
jgi:tRNA 2-thiouridine synthesizing protein A